MKRLVYITIAVIFILSGSIPVLAGHANSETDFACSDVTEIPQTECEALVALYNSTNGATWTDNTNWLMTNTPGNWYGVTVDSGHVIGLELDYVHLLGSLPEQIQDLTNLQYLSLDENKLSGSLPIGLGYITSLQLLSLYKNLLS